jgi:hypothetical protein
MRPRRNRVNEVNVVNKVNVYERVTFTTYPHETKGLVNVVNVARGYFGLSRTRIAKRRSRSKDSVTTIEPIPNADWDIPENPWGSSGDIPKPSRD